MKLRKFGFQGAQVPTGQIGGINTSAPWGRCGSAAARGGRERKSTIDSIAFIKPRTWLCIVRRRPGDEGLSRLFGRVSGLRPRPRGHAVLVRRAMAKGLAIPVATARLPPSPPCQWITVATRDTAPFLPPVCHHQSMGKLNMRERLFCSSFPVP